MEPTSFTHYRSLKSPVPALWPCLTQPERLAAWMGEAEIDLGWNGALWLKLWNGDAIHGRVIAAVPTARLELAWKPFDFDPESHVVWRLGADGPGSRLTVTHDGLRSREERDHARLFWRDSLDALAQYADRNHPASEWGGSHPVTMRTVLPQTAAELWPLFSSASGLTKWVANVEEFEPQAGSAFRFRSSYKGQDIVEQGVVQEVVPESRLKLSWEWVGEGWSAPTELLFALEPDPAGSTVLISHSGFDRIEGPGALAARRNYASAWAEVLSDLRALVAPAAAR